MVTTNSTAQEIRNLFDQAGEKAQQLVLSIDQEESDLVKMLRELFDGRIRALLPMLKYVDQEIELDLGSGNGEVDRGIELESNLVLTRNGRIYFRLGRNYIDYTDLRLGDGVDEVAEHVFSYSEVLSRTLDEALAKIEQRQSGLQDLRRRIGEDTDRLNKQK